ncbi:MAG: response regulator [bacterium]|nr:response regulator [bacterium]
MTDGKPTILIVDDDPSILVLLRKSLAATCDVLTATDAKQAIDMFRLGEDTIELILLDLGMPGLSGYDALAELQLLDPDVKVAIITGLDPDEDRLPGVLGILSKPFRPREVVEFVWQVMQV